MVESNESASWPPALLVMAVAVVGAAVGAVVCYLLVAKAHLGQDVALLVVGPIVGGLVRLATRGAAHPQAVVVAVLAFCGAVAGFIWGDYALFLPFMPDETARRLLSLEGVILLGVTTYLAYLIAVRR